MGDEAVSAPAWTSAALAVPHGFLGRRGGISEGAMASLNCGWGSGDDLALIQENRRRAADAVLPGARIVSPYQVHGVEVLEAGDWSDDERPHADALVTDRPGILLGILTADCAPLLFADSEAGVVGAAHAGWRGALGGVAEATIGAMEKLGAQRDRIAAAIGPTIARASYEVDHAFPDPFLAADDAAERFFSDGPAGKPHFDLPAYLLHRLAAAGLRRVEALWLDTYAREEDFYSFRRSTHRGEPNYGRQISLVGLRQR
ncbi:peptidoglycan editing factor PgeF [Sphingomonas sp. LHG3406-1]|uniref:peptidoglycan editing factor PgeF n=1 Tax=Sphingomonas sp. LHG3406-1 TaxID=2804617 RepID=UPI0026327FAB|nr:peptidoglycan editing factor PgeF [Sphingomonas sp. LHG3406-1]